MSGQDTTAAKNKIGAENVGARGRGRPKGAVNKTTAMAKEAISLAFDQLGGTEALVNWAKSDPDNMKVFYAQIWTKIIPLQVNGSGNEGQHVHEVVLRGVRPS